MKQATKPATRTIHYLTSTEAADLVEASHDVLYDDVRQGRLVPDAQLGGKGARKVYGYLPDSVRAWWAARAVKRGRPYPDGSTTKARATRKGRKRAGRKVATRTRGPK